MQVLMQVCINTGAMCTLNCITFIYLGVYMYMMSCLLDVALMCWL